MGRRTTPPDHQFRFVEDEHMMAINQLQPGTAIPSVSSRVNFMGMYWSFIRLMMIVGEVILDSTWPAIEGCPGSALVQVGLFRRRIGLFKDRLRHLHRLPAQERNLG